MWLAAANANVTGHHCEICRQSTADVLTWILLQQNLWGWLLSRSLWCRVTPTLVATGSTIFSPYSQLSLYVSALLAWGGGTKAGTSFGSPKAGEAVAHPTFPREDNSF